MPDSRPAVVFAVSAHTVRKWRARYQAAGWAGLADRSSRPHTSAPGPCVVGLQAASLPIHEGVAHAGRPEIVEIDSQHARLAGVGEREPGGGAQNPDGSEEDGRSIEPAHQVHRCATANMTAQTPRTQSARGQSVRVMSGSFSASGDARTPAGLARAVFRERLEEEWSRARRDAVAVRGK